MARQATGRTSKRAAAKKASARKSAAKKSRRGSRSGRAAKKPSKSARSSARKARSRSAGRRSREPKELHDLFHETLKDVYHAEKQLVRALPKMAKAAQMGELRDAFETHLQETQDHVQRLEQVFQMMGERASAKPCHGMMGLVEEGSEAMEEFKNSDPGDAAIIGAAQAVEHYEIARYGTLRTWASQLGMDDAVSLLDQTLAEEKHADELLTQIAEGGANLQAAA
jgi:ferritin-like metal-binding protein YciE